LRQGASRFQFNNTTPINLTNLAGEPLTQFNMDDSFALRAAARSQDELYERVNNREKYLPETVEASVNELRYRGEIFSGEELTVIHEDMQARRDLAGTPAVGSGPFNNRDKNNFVEDPDAPRLFSRSKIYFFSVLFSVLFGSVMMAVNVSKTPNRSKAIWVVLFGLAFTGSSALLALNFHLNSGLAILLTIAGAYLLEFLFWKRYIGESTLYRPSTIWIPLIIALIIYIPIIILIIYAGAPQ
jgi:hypothetical protein